MNRMKLAILAGLMFLLVVVQAYLSTFMPVPAMVRHALLTFVNGSLIFFFARKYATRAKE